MEGVVLTLLMSSTCIMSSLVLGRNDSETETAAVLVIRRTKDVTYFQANETRTCNRDNNVTYLVVENQCTENSYLFNGKMKLDLSNWPDFINRLLYTHLYIIQNAPLQ